MTSALPVLRKLGRVAQEPTAVRMRAFTDSRTADTPDEIWLCEHPPVYTQGVAGRPEHVHDSGVIPVVQSDRGGQVTYHGPGQVVAYPLIDLKRLGIYVKEYVFRLEHALLKTLEDFQVTGHRVRGEPGIYVCLDDPFGHAVRAATPAAPAAAAKGEVANPFAGLGKIAALGVKVSRHCSYHGVALNVAMDLSPFSGIDACGHAGLRTVDLSTIGVQVAWDDAAEALAAHLAAALSP